VRKTYPRRPRNGSDYDRPAIWRRYEVPVDPDWLRQDIGHVPVTLWAKDGGPKDRVRRREWYAWRWAGTSTAPSVVDGTLEEWYEVAGLTVEERMAADAMVAGLTVRQAAAATPGLSYPTMWRRMRDAKRKLQELLG